MTNSSKTTRQTLQGSAFRLNNTTDIQGNTADLVVSINQNRTKASDGHPGNVVCSKRQRQELSLSNRCTTISCSQLQFVGGTVCEFEVTLLNMDFLVRIESIKTYVALGANDHSCNTICGDTQGIIALSIETSISIVYKRD